MKKQTMLAVALGVSCALSLAACGSNSESAPTEAATTAAAQETEGTTEAKAAEAETTTSAAEEKDYSDIKIGISIPQLSNAAWRVWADQAIAACKSLGIQYVVVDADGDDTAQYNQIMDLCANGVDGIILNGNQDATIESMLEVADDYGVPMIVTGRSPGFLPSEYEGDSYIMFQGCNWEISGYEQAKALYDAGYHKVVASGGKQGVSVADARYRGLEMFAEDCDDFEIVAGLRTDETRTQGMENMENFLSAYKGQFDCVWTTNDDVALGCLEALTAEGLNGKIGLGGIDVLDECREAMHNGEQHFDTFSDPYSIEWAAVVSLFDYINGYEPDQEELSFGLLMLYPDNIQLYEDAFVNGTCDIDAKQFSKTFNPDAKTKDLEQMVECPVPVVTTLERIK